MESGGSTRRQDSAESTEGVWSLASIGAMVVLMGGYFSIAHGPAQNMAQLVWRVSLLAVGLSLLAIDGVRRLKPRRTVQTAAYIGIPLIAIAVIACIGAKYHQRHAPLDPLMVTGVIRDNTYVNEALGLTIPLEKSWHASTEDPVSSNAVQLENQSLPDGRKVGDVATLATDDMRIILVVSRDVLGGPEVQANPNLMVQLVRVPPISAEKFIQKNEDFLKKAGMPMRRIRNMERSSVGGTELVSVLYKYDVPGGPWCEIRAAVLDGFALMLQAVYVEEDDRRKIAAMVDGLQLTEP